MTQRLVVVAIVVLAAIGGVVYWMSGRDAPAAATAADTAGSNVGSTGSGRVATTKPTSKIKRIDPARRKEVAEQIERAQQARAKSAASDHESTESSSGSNRAPGRGSSSDLSQSELEVLSKSALAIMKDVDPMLKDCWRQALPDHPDLEIKSTIMLSSDPDVGTLIDSEDVFDGNDKPLPPTLHDCVYDVLANIELPPLPQGGKVKFTTSTTFNHAHPDDETDDDKD